MRQETQNFYEFGPFRLLASEGLLLRDNQPVPLPPKAIDTLLVLVRQSGHVVLKDELMQEVWPDTFVEESNLTQNIFLLRKALGEGSEGQTYIETIPKRGYRFVAPVRSTGAESVHILVHERTRAQLVVEEDEAAEKRLLAARPRRGRWLALAAVLVAAVGFGSWALWNARKPVAPSIHSLAVLPFVPIGGTEEDKILGLGLADTLITRLSSLEPIVVRPTSAVRRYAGPTQNAQEAGRQQRVDAVLEGSLQRSADRIRVSVRLVRVQDGLTLWADTFDGASTDILDLQDSIATQTASALAVELTGERRARLAKRHTENPQAYQFYLKGRYFWSQRTAEGLKKGLECFQQAVELDPRYAPGYVGIADSYIVLANYGYLTQHEAKPKAKAAVLRALELDNTLAEAHLSLAGILAEYDYRIPEAEREFERALALDPNYANAHHWYAAHLEAVGRFDKAIAEAKRAQELDPISPRITVDVGRAYCYARKYEQAIEQYRNALHLDPAFAPARVELGLAYSNMGLHEQAIAVLEENQRRTGGVSGSLGYAYARGGRRQEALKTLAAMEHRWNQEKIGAAWIAAVYAGLGDKERALGWLEMAYLQRETYMLKAQPQWDTLRSEPRFQDLLRRMSLPPD
ncbi:MAG TPA: tetratricopeptide repeat protein [Candidatus Xenobia bacterium]|nr:tetratricopeptide repeat protein [Candidatus Xenobia bacterium]